MENWIPWLIYIVLSNIPFEMLIIACGLSISHAIRRKMLASRQSLCDQSLRYVLFWAVGISGFWGFVMHAFFAHISSNYIGWQVSPFEFEVAVANLGLGVIGIMCAWRGFEFRLATTIMVSCFSWGAAIGHVYQMKVSHDFSSGNAGAIFYTDILIPAMLWFLIIMRQGKNA